MVVATLVNPKTSRVFDWKGSDFSILQLRKYIEGVFGWAGSSIGFDIFAVNENEERVKILDCDTLVKEFLDNNRFMYHVEVERVDLRGQPEPKHGTFDILSGDFLKIYDAIQKSPHYNTHAAKDTKMQKLFRSKFLHIYVNEFQFFFLANFLMFAFAASRKTVIRWSDKFIPAPSKRQKSREPSQEAVSGQPQELAPPAIVPPSLPPFGTSSQLVLVPTNTDRPQGLLPPSMVPQVPATNTLSQPPGLLISAPNFIPHI
nr:uncharacterized protein LOC117279032 [Nicotiana tomentosiformis]